MFKRRKNVEPPVQREPWKKPENVKRRTSWTDDQHEKAVRLRAKIAIDRELIIDSMNQDRPTKRKDTIAMLVKGIKNLSNNRNNQSYDDEGWY